MLIGQVRTQVVVFFFFFFFFFFCLFVCLFFHAESEDSDQTGRKPRLI